jgi:adenylate cyclase class IV
MQTEYEAKILDIDKDDVRQRLGAAGAELIQPEYLQKRYVFELPLEKRSPHTFVRVRDEGHAITMTWKRFSGGAVDHPDESEITVDDFDNAVEILTEIGCTPTSFQESYRELWHLGAVKVTIDTWPFYSPFIEVEGTSEESVQEALERLGFAWDDALKCGVSRLFKMRYGEHVNIREMPRLVFDMPDPFA